MKRLSVARQAVGTLRAGKLEEVDNRRMCPNCRAFVTSADRVCPYCDVQLGPRAVERRDVSGTIAGLIPNARFTTSMILLLNFAFYLATMFDDSHRLINAGASNQLVFAGQWWRLITAGFFHGGVFHILMNSWVLFDLGSQVEDVYGSERLIVFYFLSTIGGFLLSAYLGHAAVGASAGVYGLIGVMIALGRSARSTLGDHVAGFYTRWAIFGLVMSFLPGIDLAAHLGGLAVGFGVAFLAGHPNPFNQTGDTLWRWASYACLGITALALMSMFSSFLRV